MVGGKMSTWQTGEETDARKGYPYNVGAPLAGALKYLFLCVLVVFAVERFSK